MTGAEELLLVDALSLHRELAHAEERLAHPERQAARTTIALLRALASVWHRASQTGSLNLDTVQVLAGLLEHRGVPTLRAHVLGVLGVERRRQAVGGGDAGAMVLKRWAELARVVADKADALERTLERDAGAA